MKVTTELRDDHQVNLTLELDAQELERAKRRVAREYARRVKIPGFRPGKAPYEVVARKVGEATIQQEAIEALLDEYYPKALEEADIKPYDAGALEEVVSTDPPVFKLVVPLAIDVDLGDYRSVRLPYEPPEVDDEEVDQVLDSYRQMFATLEPVDRPAEVGDVVYVNVEAYEEGKEDGEPLFADQNHPLLIEKEPREGEWPYPGFPEAFEGAQVGDTKTLVYTYPQDADDEDLRGKTVVFKAEVTEIKARSVPELDDEFVKNLGDEIESAEQLREMVRADLQQRKQAAYDAEYLEKMLDEIIAQATLKYPPQVVDDEVNVRMDEYKEEAERRGQTWKEYLKARGVDEETLAAEVREEVEPQVRRRLVLSAIADEEELEIDENEVMETARQNLVQMLAYVDRKEARRLARDQRFVQEIIISTARDALIEKAMDFVIALGKGEVEEEETETEEAAEAESTEAEPEVAGAEAEPEAATDEDEEVDAEA